MSYQPVYRDGRVHVHRRMCETCIFRPGNLMHLADGVVEEMVAEATRRDGSIPCHETLDDAPAVCRGFYAQHAPPTLQLAHALGIIVEVEPPEEWR